METLATPTNWLPSRAPQRRELQRHSFSPLLERNTAVTTQVSELTSSAPLITVTNSYGKQQRQKVLVVLGNPYWPKKPQVETAPVLVCGLSSVWGLDHADRRSDGALKAEFAYALIPWNRLEHFIDDSHDLHNPKQPSTIRQYPPVETPSRDTIDRGIQLTCDGALLFGAIMRKKHYDAIEQVIGRTEHMLYQITSVMATLEINSHLQPPSVITAV